MGGDLAEPALRSLRWGGRFVTVGFASGTIPRIPAQPGAAQGLSSVLGFQFRDFATHMAADWPATRPSCSSCWPPGRPYPYIGATFDLAEAAAALRHVADGKAIGKVVLQVAPV